MKQMLYMRVVRVFELLVDAHIENLLSYLGQCLGGIVFQCWKESTEVNRIFVGFGKSIFLQPLGYYRGGIIKISSHLIIIFKENII